MISYGLWPRFKDRGKKFGRRHTHRSWIHNLYPTYKRQHPNHFSEFPHTTFFDLPYMVRVWPDTHNKSSGKYRKTFVRERIFVFGKGFVYNWTNYWFAYWRRKITISNTFSDNHALSLQTFWLFVEALSDTILLIEFKRVVRWQPIVFPILWPIDAVVINVGQHTFSFWIRQKKINLHFCHSERQWFKNSLLFQVLAHTVRRLGMLTTHGSQSKINQDSEVCALHEH